MSTSAQEAKARKLEEKYKKNTLNYETKYFRRCKLTGRSRAVFRKFGICRNKFRELALQGLLPGVRKSSW